jgi:hypothetical protein
MKLPAGNQSFASAHGRARRIEDDKRVFITASLRKWPRVFWRRELSRCMPREGREGEEIFRSTVLAQKAASAGKSPPCRLHPKNTFTAARKLDPRQTGLSSDAVFRERRHES